MRSITKFGLCAAFGLALCGAAQPADEPAGTTMAPESAEAAPAPQSEAEVTVPPADESPTVPEAAPSTAEAFDKAFEADKAEVAPEPASAEAGAAPKLAPKLARGDPVTREFLVGIWAEPDKSCAAGIDFQADGKMIGPFPRWELEDGQLTMVGNRQKMRLTVIDKDTMQSRRSETDPPRTLKRCAATPPPPQP